MLYQIVDDLTEETGDTGHRSLAFHVASDLHINYYERWLPPARVVQRGVADVQLLLIDKLEALAGSKHG